MFVAEPLPSLFADVVPVCFRAVLAYHQFLAVVNVNAFWQPGYIFRCGIGYYCCAGYRVDITVCFGICVYLVDRCCTCGEYAHFIAVRQVCQTEVFRIFHGTRTSVYGYAFNGVVVVSSHYYYRRFVGRNSDLVVACIKLKHVVLAFAYTINGNISRIVDVYVYGYLRFLHSLFHYNLSVVFHNETVAGTKPSGHRSVYRNY